MLISCCRDGPTPRVFHKTKCSLTLWRDNLNFSKSFYCFENPCPPGFDSIQHPRPWALPCTQCSCLKEIILCRTSPALAWSQRFVTKAQICNTMVCNTMCNKVIRKVRRFGGGNCQFRHNRASNA
jgi:hypothetical protein